MKFTVCSKKCHHFTKATKPLIWQLPHDWLCFSWHKVIYQQLTQSFFLISFLYWETHSVEEEKMLVCLRKVKSLTTCCRLFFIIFFASAKTTCPLLSCVPFAFNFISIFKIALKYCQCAQQIIFLLLCSLWKYTCCIWSCVGEEWGGALSEAEGRLGTDRALGK